MTIFMFLFDFYQSQTPTLMAFTGVTKAHVDPRHSQQHAGLQHTVL